MYTYVKSNVIYYCKPKNFSDLTIIATSGLRPHNNNYNSNLRPHNNSYNSDLKKTLLKFSTIFFIALYIIYKLKGNR